jgi:hypothetical protein
MIFHEMTKYLIPLLIQLLLFIQIQLKNIITTVTYLLEMILFDEADQQDPYASSTE